MTILLLCLAVVIVAFAWQESRAPIKHPWRRRQARIMCEAFRGRDRSQPSALTFARLRAMDALAFEELLLESFERRGHSVIRTPRSTGDGEIDGQVAIRGRAWLIQAKRYRAAIRPEHVRAFATLCSNRGASGLFIDTGRTGGANRKVAARHGSVEIISGQRLLTLVTGAPLVIGGRVL